MWAFQDALAAGLDQEQPGIIQVLALSADREFIPTLWHAPVRLYRVKAQIQSMDLT